MTRENMNEIEYRAIQAKDSMTELLTSLPPETVNGSTQYVAVKDIATHLINISRDLAIINDNIF